jgi:hypothetical protein
MREVVARYEHDGRAWVVQILDPDIATFGLTLRSAKRYARELVKTYAEVDDLAAAGIELVDDVVLPANVEAEIDQLAEMRREAEVLRHDVAIETRRATQQLRRAGFSTRDVGEILGISSARVAQIEREVPAV